MGKSPFGWRTVPYKEPEWFYGDRVIHGEVWGPCIVPVKKMYGRVYKVGHLKRVPDPLVPEEVWAKHAAWVLTQ